MIVDVKDVLVGVAVPEADGAALAGGAEEGGAAGTVLDASQPLTGALWGSQGSRDLKWNNKNQLNNK